MPTLYLYHWIDLKTLSLIHTAQAANTPHSLCTLCCFHFHTRSGNQTGTFESLYDPHSFKCQQCKDIPFSGLQMRHIYDEDHLFIIFFHWKQTLKMIHTFFKVKLLESQL